MVVGVRRRSIGVFSNRRDAEEALHELRNSGFPMDRVSVIARDADNQDDIAGTQVSDRIGDKSDEGARVGAATGGALGGLTGLLVGLGTLAIPGIGPIMLAGATATAIATTIAGAGIGAVAGSLIGALIGLGIPEERARVYNDRVQRGGYLVIVDGSDDEIARAEAILHRRGIEEYGIYNHPDSHGLHPEIGHAKHALGYFNLRQDAEAAINDLRVANFPVSQISLIHRESINQDALRGVNFSDRLDAVRYGLPDDRTRFYNERINQGDYIVAVSGTDDEIHRAAAILNRHRIQQWQIFDPRSHSTTPIHQHQNRRAVGVFSHRRDAEAALNELRDAGFPMNHVSLIAKDTDGHGVAGVGNKADEGAKAGAATGGALGGLGGLLVGLGALAIPGIGPVIAGGALATALATTVAGGAIGAAAGGLVGALVGLGIPEDRARVYSDRFQRGDYLVMVDGTEAEIQHAHTILQRRGIEDFGIFDATDVNPEHNRGADWTRHQETPVIETGRTNHPVIGNHSDPSVTIVDRRDDIL
ncbi:histidine kinase [Nostoc sp. LEGE 06077]|uniref:general stress protein n=1 Tax=Nostoc sp. LEGE 06077 TaxID=915325 RepID=UPI0018811F9E|nr:general stress protein [Nostoc sp. LEGE 06077]MBE9210791.1 histidine kinase [Nostoc sp. LEGE 06077]